MDVPRFPRDSSLSQRSLRKKCADGVHGDDCGGHYNWHSRSYTSNPCYQYRNNTQTDGREKCCSLERIGSLESSACHQRRKTNRDDYGGKPNAGKNVHPVSLCAPSNK